MIGYLLHVANSNPPVVSYHRDGLFYAMKDQILHALGERETHDTLFGPEPNYDWQVITHPCWGCQQCKPDHWRWNGCNGDGIYSRTYVRLERWRLGGYTFHKPTGRYGAMPEGSQVTITGLVQHKDYGPWSWRAAFLLALVFDQHFAWRMFGRTAAGRALDRLYGVVYRFFVGEDQIPF